MSSKTKTATPASSSAHIKSIAITAICLVLVFVFTALVNIRLPSGWTLWAPFTLVIVGCMGLVVGAIAEKHQTFPFYLLALVAACAIKIVGYYFAEAIIYGNLIVPITSIPGNLIQVGVAAVITLVIIHPLRLAVEHTGLRK